MAKIVRAVNVEVPIVGHCYPYYPVSVVLDSGNFKYYTEGTTKLYLHLFLFLLQHSTTRPMTSRKTPINTSARYHLICTSSAPLAPDGPLRYNHSPLPANYIPITSFSGVTYMTAIFCQRATPLSQTQNSQPYVGPNSKMGS